MIAVDFGEIEVTHAHGVAVYVVPERLTGAFRTVLEMGQRALRSDGYDLEARSLDALVAVAELMQERRSAQVPIVADGGTDAVEYVSVKDLAAEIGITDRAIRAAIADARLCSVMIRGQHRVARDEADRFKQERKTP